MSLERRYVPIGELRMDPGAGQGTITGYAAVFDTPSLQIGDFQEVVKVGAFRRSIQEGDVRALFNHDPNFVIGRTRSGTLALQEDQHGLAIRATPPETTWARDLVTSIRRGDISQMSFGFVKRADEWRMVGGVRTRFLLDVDLLDVSPVTYPAYPNTTVGARAHEEELAQFRARGLAALPAGRGDAPGRAGGDSDLSRRRRLLELYEDELDPDTKLDLEMHRLRRARGFSASDARRRLDQIDLEERVRRLKRHQRDAGPPWRPAA